MGFLTREKEGPPRPLPNTYWVIPDRILAGEYPGDVADELTRARITRLHEAGIDAFFDLTEEGEMPPYRHLLPQRTEYLRSAIADTWVPNNVAQTKDLLTAMHAALARNRALYVPDKLTRVYNYHHSSLHALAELLAAAGLEHPQELRPIHFSQRSSTTEVRSFAQLYPALRPGELLDGTDARRYREAWAMARADTFQPAL